MPFAQRISEIACLRSKDPTLFPPMVFSDPKHLGKFCLDCMQVHLRVCMMEVSYNGNIDYAATNDLLSQSLNDTLETLAWLSRRQIELGLFQQLQCSANQLLARTKKCSERQNHMTAKFLFLLLISGSFDERKAQVTTTENDNTGGLLAKATYLEQKRRVRCDLLRYFGTIIENIPSWNYFFDDLIGYGDCNAQELLREACADLGNFDERAIRYHSVIKDRLTQWLEWQEGIDSYQSYDVSELDQDAEIDLAWFESFHRDVLRGTPYKSDVNAIEMELNKNIEPRLNTLIQFFADFAPEMAAVLEELMVKLGSLQEALREDLKQFGGLHDS
ncbi:hypothetical protein N7451_004961 [Penicillium sp. IBT 35674x]|nr:hypothetical protein N7451_004961 [Penicillium sp. IBT 35674x]